MCVELHRKKSYDRPSISLRDNGMYLHFQGLAHAFNVYISRFSEMHSEQPAVEVLRYLQTDVFNIVDHNNSKEMSIFRSLLAHSPSPSVVIPATDANPNTGRRNRPSSSDNVAFIEREFDGDNIPQLSCFNGLSGRFPVKSYHTQAAGNPLIIFRYRSVVSGTSRSNWRDHLHHPLRATVGSSLLHRHS